MYSAARVAAGPRADAGGEAAAVLRYEVQGVPYVFYARKPDAAAAAAAKPFKPYRCAQRRAHAPLALGWPTRRRRLTPQSLTTAAAATPPLLVPPAASPRRPQPLHQCVVGRQQCAARAL